MPVNYPKLNVSATMSADAMTLTLYDTTGDYNNPNNLGGYGAPNLTRADVATSTLLLTSPDGTLQYTITAALPTPDPDPTKVLLATIVCPLPTPATLVPDGITPPFNNLCGCCSPQEGAPAVPQTCLVDGCWTIMYVQTYTDNTIPALTLTVAMPIYQNTEIAFQSVQNLLLSDQITGCGCGCNGQDHDLKQMLLDIQNTFDMMFSIMTGNQCDCVTISKYLTEIQNSVLFIQNNCTT